MHGPAPRRRSRPLTSSRNLRLFPIREFLVSTCAVEGVSGYQERPAVPIALQARILVRPTPDPEDLFLRAQGVLPGKLSNDRVEEYFGLDPERFGSVGVAVAFDVLLKRMLDRLGKPAVRG